RPEWRPLRWGLGVLLAVQVIGLNLWAWHQRTQLEDKRESAFAIVKSAFPRVNPLDVQRAPMLVMQREADAAKLAAGQPGDADFEPMLQAAALAWPSDQAPAESIRYGNGSL